MAKKTNDESARQERLSPRMESFIESVIEEVEEAGIDDEYAEEDLERKPATRVASPTVYARRRTHR
jgi:hypothetical protein